MSYKMTQQLEGIARESDTPKMKPITGEQCPECNQQVDYVNTQPVCNNTNCNTYFVKYEQ